MPLGNYQPRIDTARRGLPSISDKRRHDSDKSRLAIADNLASGFRVQGLGLATDFACPVLHID
jgi:hypothetical protein